MRSSSAGLAPRSPAEAAGLQPGDRIVSADDKDISTWKQFYMATAARANRPVRLVVERDGKRIERQLVPVPIDRYETGAVGVLPVMHPQIDSLQKGPARRGRRTAEGRLHPCRRCRPKPCASRRRNWRSSPAMTFDITFAGPRGRPRANAAHRSDSGARRAVPWRSMCCGQQSGSPSLSRRARSKGWCASAPRSRPSSSRPSSRGQSKPSS